MPQVRKIASIIVSQPLIACRGAAILWTHPYYHSKMEPLTTSHLYKGTLHEKFYQQGTDDQTNFFAVPGKVLNISTKALITVCVAREKLQLSITDQSDLIG